MIFQAAVLCDAATNEHEKLNLLGAFDTIFAPKLPAVHPQCSIALRITFSQEDEGNHVLRLNFVDADGRSIMPGIDLPCTITLAGDSHFVTRNFVVSIQRLVFDRPGLYSLDVAWDGESRTSIPLMVKLATADEPAAGAP